MRGVLAIGFAALTACGDNSDHGTAIYTWDGSRVLGSLRIDAEPADYPVANRVMDERLAYGGVALFYGHLSLDGTAATLESVLAHAAADGLPFLTFKDLVDGPPRAGVAISFDDMDYPEWTAARPLLARYGAHVTLFVTGYPSATDDERAQLHALAADGHDVEAHSIHHINALEYTAAHGMQALLDDEILPSFDVLEADGFEPCCYAHPYGATSVAIDQAILDTGRAALIRRITPRL